MTEPRMTKKKLKELLDHYRLRWAKVRVVVSQATTAGEFTEGETFTDEHYAMSHWRMLNESNWARKMRIMADHPDTGIPVELYAYTTGTRGVKSKQEG